MNLRILEKIGLAVFLIGFTAWLMSLSWEKYVLSKPILIEVLGESATEELLAINEEKLVKEYATSFDLVAKLEVAFREVNRKRLEQYSYSEEIIDQLVLTLVGEQFRFDEAAVVFDTANKVGKYQFETLKSWGGSLEGRQFTSDKELAGAIRQHTANIEKWAIVNDLGYSSYAVKDMTYALVKASSVGLISENPALVMLLIYGASIIGALMYILPGRTTHGPPGIKNDNVFRSVVHNKGWIGILLGTFLIVFYIVLYFFPEYMTPWIIMADPLSYWLKGQEAGRFFLYGFIYTLAILVMGVRMLIKYRHSRYQVFRTISVMFFQLAFAFLIPEFLMRLNQPYFDFKNIWPLDYDFFFDYEIDNLIKSGAIGIFMLGWGIGLIVIAVPVLVYFYGKRWYCSWVCGCGGLAETLGDPFRQLSDKSLKAWKVERWMIHAILVFAVLMTVGVLYTYWTGNSNLLGVSTYSIRSIYGSWIGAGFAGVVGTGFYPLMGNRVWCRFGCPLAAYLGLVQRFKSRFRITTNGGQCISCGNCSTYCEMGIDVRWYAQRGENIVRSSCVGCGVCSAVCPRGVLNLENRSDNNRFEPSGLIGNNSFTEEQREN